MSLISEKRGAPLAEIEGDELIQELLQDVEDEERLSAALGVDLCPAAPDPRHAPVVYAPLVVWLRRSEEIHGFREQTRRAEHRRRPR